MDSSFENRTPRQQSTHTIAELHRIPEGRIPVLIESRGYVCPARTFREQLTDTDRVTQYEYLGEGLRSPNETSSEYQGLVELARFLKTHAKDNAMARGMLDSLNFIGEKELQEATAGLAAYWKRFLDSKPDAQLCAVAGISGVKCSCCAPTHRGMIRSDRYIIERILEHFTDEELDRYRGRLLLGLNHVRGNREATKVVLVDDWIISGQQMELVVRELRRSVHYPDIEINLITAPANLIDKGFTPEGHKQPTPVKAYFMAHTATGPVDPASGSAYITGIHCSADRNFAGALQRMEHPGPSLTRIRKNYEARGLPRTQRMKP